MLRVSTQPVSFFYLLMKVIWPAFIVAGVASGLIFSFISPDDLAMLDKQLELSDLGVYTLGFFVFWILGMMASGLTALLLVEFNSSDK